jgi:hypothetical protein
MFVGGEALSHIELALHRGLMFTLEGCHEISKENRGKALKFEYFDLSILLIDPILCRLYSINFHDTSLYPTFYSCIQL